MIESGFGVESKAGPRKAMGAVAAPASDFWRWTAIVAALLLGIFGLMPKLGPSATPTLTTAHPVAAADFSLLHAINPWFAPR